MRWVAASIAVLSAACAMDPGPSSVQCTSSSDCASDEKCSEGVCTAAGRVISRDRPDAGAPMMQPMTPAKDAGGTPVQPDSGMSMQPADSGVVTPADSGCNTGITVVELPGRSFCTISEAIIAAPESGTVDVPSASCNESLTIDKPLTVRGAAPVTIQAVPSSVVLTINANDVVITGVVLEASGNDGVNLSGNATLQDVTIKNSVGAGIRVLTAGSVLNTRNVLVSRVTCAGACGTEDWGEGMVFQSGTSGILIDTNIEDTDFIGIYAQNAVVRMENGWIKRAGRTYCQQNDQMCLPGVYMYETSSGVFNTNTWIQESGGSGIEIIGSALELRDSRVENNGMRLVSFVDGIYAENSNATVANNVISNNLGFGIGCEGEVVITSCADNTHEENQQGWTNGLCGGCP
jgi:nitrous oxidase accessory protein NosD